MVLYPLKFRKKANNTVGGHKLDHLAINSTTAVASKAGFTLASAHNPPEVRTAKIAFTNVLSQQQQ